MVNETAVKVSQAGGTLLDRIVDFIIPRKIVLFLNTNLCYSTFFIFNYWSIVHFFAGIIFYFLFPNRLKLWLWVHIIFEIIEYLLAFGGNPLFVEELADSIWDIIWSMLGFMLVQYIKERKIMWNNKKLITKR